MVKSDHVWYVLWGAGECQERDTAVLNKFHFLDLKSFLKELGHSFKEKLAEEGASI